MRAGLIYAISACCIWGFAFVGPLILSDWPGLAVAAGRYIGYGLGSILTLVVLWRRGTARLKDRGIWRDAILLTLTGNLLYYALLSVAVQKAGYVMPTLIIGLLPVTVSLAARFRDRQPMTARYVWALVLILGGLWLAHSPSSRGTAEGSHETTTDEAFGLLCAFGSLALWTMYGVMNAERMKRYGGISGVQWSSLQGAAALPFALMLFVATKPALPQSREAWGLFIAVSLFLGLLVSWTANALWNMASTRLPSSLLGQLIVFETIAGIAYGAVWSAHWPAASVLAGTVVLVLGVIVALSEKQKAIAVQIA